MIKVVLGITFISEKIQKVPSHLELICQLKSDRDLKFPTELKEGEYYKVSFAES